MQTSSNTLWPCECLCWSRRKEQHSQLLTPARSAVELPLGGTEQSVCDSVRLSVWAQGVRTHARVCLCVSKTEWLFKKGKRQSKCASDSFTLSDVIRIDVAHTCTCVRTPVEDVV